MSIRSLTQTRWKLEPNRVTIYPYRYSYILSAIFAVAFAVIIFLYINYIPLSPRESISLVLVLLLVVVIIWGFAGTSVEFDNHTGTMRKNLMGFIPVTTIPFAKLQGISPVSNLYGSYKYRLFRKDALYGKGVLVSCAYAGNDDPNEVAFVEEVATTINGYLNAHDFPSDYNRPDY